MKFSFDFEVICEKCGDGEIEEICKAIHNFGTILRTFKCKNCGNIIFVIFDISSVSEYIFRGIYNI